MKANHFKMDFCISQRDQLGLLYQDILPNLFGNIERWVIRGNYNSFPLDLIIGCDSKYKAMCVEDKQISLELITR